MKKKTLLALLLAGCCLLAGCSASASDEAVFADRSPAVLKAVRDEGPAPSENPPDDAVERGGEAGLNEEAVPSRSARKLASAPATLAAGRSVCVDAVDMSGAVSLEDEMVPLAASPSAVSVLSPAASGTAVKSGGGAEIDYSNTKDGYVMVRFAGSSGSRLRVQVAGPTTTYTYDLTTGDWVTYPMSDGNGNYKVTVLQNISGKKYAILTSASFQVALADEFAPFLRPNQYVNYQGAVNTIAKAAELTGNISDPLKKVAAVYDFVVKNLTYHHARAASVQSGYLPNLDSVLAERKGICFDYAALMTGMLRSQGVPCKLVVGYAGTQYHAWVSVWTAATGWVDGVIYFDGTNWQRMDPTFASSGNTQFTLNANNYKVKYLY